MGSGSRSDRDSFEVALKRWIPVSSTNVKDFERAPPVVSGRSKGEVMIREIDAQISIESKSSSSTHRQAKPAKKRIGEKR